MTEILVGRSPGSEPHPSDLASEVRDYWNRQIHDIAMTRSPVGTAEFFAELDAYRFGKLDYLDRLVDFGGYADREVLELGCGAGVDLARFARGGARVTGVDLAENAIYLARQNFSQAGLEGDLRVANAGALPFQDAAFDLVYCHGVLQYADDPAAIVAEARRLVRPGGAAIFMVYNSRSWLAWMSRVLRTSLEHSGAPVFRTYTAAEFRALLAPFAECTIVAERFPARTRLQRGWKAFLYNRVLIPVLDRVPRAWIRPYGWHLMAFCAPGAPAGQTTGEGR
jgi:SAM-dependent methyltransferase